MGGCARLASDLSEIKRRGNVHGLRARVAPPRHATADRGMPHRAAGRGRVGVWARKVYNVHRRSEGAGRSDSVYLLVLYRCAP